jgi:hypothetical protein
LTPSAILLAVGVLPILVAYRSAGSGSFATQYAASAPVPSDIFGGAIAALIPFAPVIDEGTPSIAVPLVALLVLLFAGWHEALRVADSRRHRLNILVLALAVPIVGSVVYAPWPFYQLIYALPFLTAGALLVGQATSSLLSSARAGIVGALSVVIVLTFAATQAANESSRNPGNPKGGGNCR